ncbi:MAG: hypothetical protein ACOYJG_08635 [Prevotella sp.]|jgi:hypothetical protein
MKKIVLMLLCAMTTLMAQAQVEIWSTIAKAPRDMQTTDYGKAEALSIEIVKDGSRQVLVDTARYVVESVEREINTDSIKSTELTATDWKGDEYVFKFNRDLYAESPLMRYCVILFAANNPYKWTYFFCKEPK